MQLSKIVNLSTSVKRKNDFSMVCTFIERYPKLLKLKDRELDKLCEEFIDYQAMSRDHVCMKILVR